MMMAKLVVNVKLDSKENSANLEFAHFVYNRTLKYYCQRKSSI